MNKTKVNESNRKDFVDIFKGIAIFLVILGHSPLCNNELKRIIYSFHMPAFFVIYGLVYSYRSHKLRGFLTKQFIVIKIKRLLLPCFAWALVYSLVNKNISLKSIVSILYGNQKGFVRASSLSSLWFLPCMFLAVMTFEIIIQMLGEHKHRDAFLLCGGMLLVLISYKLPYIKYGYPWSLDVVLLAVAFVAFGYCLQDRFTKIENEINSKIISLLSIIFGGLLLLTYRLNLHYISINNVDMASRNIGNPFLFLLDAGAGCSCLLLISIMISRYKGRISKYLSFVGKNTMIIFILHKPIVIKLSGYLSKSVLGNMVGGILASAITLFVVSFAAVITRKIYQSILAFIDNINMHFMRKV